MPHAFFAEIPWEERLAGSVDVVWLYSSYPIIPLPSEAVGRTAMEQLISFFDKQFPGDVTLPSMELITRRAGGSSTWCGQKSWKEVKVFNNI